MVLGVAYLGRVRLYRYGTRVRTCNLFPATPVNITGAVPLQNRPHNTYIICVPTVPVHVYLTRRESNYKMSAALSDLKVHIMGMVRYNRL